MAENPDDAADLGEETRRVVSAVQDWMRRSAERRAAAADPGRTAVDEVTDHARHTGSDCDWCPICQFAAALRAEHPELAGKISEAGAAVASALRAIVDAAMAHVPVPAAEDTGPERRHPRPRVEHVDLDGDGDGDA